MTSAHAGRTGRLVVGINTSISNSSLPDILQQFRNSYPAVTLVLQELVVKAGLEKLIDGSIDVDFQDKRNLQNLELAQLTYEELCRESLVLVLPKHHPLAQKRRISLPDLRHQPNLPFIMPSYESVPGLHVAITSFLYAERIPYQIVQEATWMTTILSLVAGGLGISLLPANVLNLERKGVVYRKIPGCQNQHITAMVWRQDNPSPVLQHFLAVVRAAKASVLVE